MPLTTTPSERIGLCTRMRRFLVRFIRPESFVHAPSLADFIITTSGFEFSVHTGRCHDHILALEPSPTEAGSVIRFFRLAWVSPRQARYSLPGMLKARELAPLIQIKPASGAA